MRVLVIGGAGYIGSHVVLELLANRHEATVFDNLSLGTRENLFPKADFVHGDIMDIPALDAVMARGFDAVVHLAAFKAAGESMLAPGKYARNNLNGTVNILDAMDRAGIRAFVFSSSAAVYGEPAYLPIDEKHPTSPENFYGFTKLEIERVLAWYAKLRNFRFAALRYFNAAGYDSQGRVTGLERNPANLLPVIMEVAAGMRPELQVFGTDYPTPDGTGIRDYVHVSDLARAHVMALGVLASGTKELVVNLGSERGYSVLEILETARRITGLPIPAVIKERRPGDPAKLVAGSALAGELLGWKAQCSDAESLVRTSWEVYRKHKR